MKAVIYARESSDDLSKAPDIQGQIDRCKQYAEQENIIVTQTYEDNGWSGGAWNRPAWNQLIKDARFHKFVLVLVWNQDRIARDTEMFLRFYRKLKEAYVKVYSITEGEINLESVGGVAKHVSLAMSAEIFRKVTSEKVKKAYAMKLNKARKTGEKVRWGRKPKDYDINFVTHLRSQGLGYRKIAEQVGCSYQTIRRLLLQNTPTENEQKDRVKSNTKTQVTQ